MSKEIDENDTIYKQMEKLDQDIYNLKKKGKNI